MSAWRGGRGDPLGFACGWEGEAHCTHKQATAAEPVAGRGGRCDWVAVPEAIVLFV